MKTIWACKCRSLLLCQDACVYVNKPDDEPSVYDGISCGNCSYDGNYYFKFEVPDDFEYPDDDMLPYEYELGEPEHIL